VNNLKPVFLEQMENELASEDFFEKVWIPTAPISISFLSTHDFNSFNFLSRNAPKPLNPAPQQRVRDWFLKLGFFSDEDEVLVPAQVLALAPVERVEKDGVHIDGVDDDDLDRDGELDRHNMRWWKNSGWRSIEKILVLVLFVFFVS
jgi:hypothetical protein